VQSAITVRPVYARAIASGQKTLELRNRKLLSVGQRVVVCSGAPEGLTLCECECTAVLAVADLRVADALTRACVRSLEPSQNIALELRVVQTLEPRRVRGGLGVWALRPQRHGRDSGYVL
jgi:hypothetical protein